MTRYLIINAYSARNAGDAAIMLATVALLRDRGASTIALASRYQSDDTGYYSPYGVEVVRPPAPFPPRGSAPVLARGGVLVFGLLTAFVAAVLFRLHRPAGRTAARLLRASGMTTLLESDRVIVGGGGYMYSSARRINLTLLHEMLCVRLALVARIQVVMMPQSIGPLTRRIDRRMVRWGLEGVRPVVLREPLALRAATELFGSHRETVLCPDVAFYGWQPRRHAWDSRHGGSRLIGLSVMNWSWAGSKDGEGFNRYCEEMARLAVLSLEAGREVVFCGHSRMPEQGQDDLDIARRIVTRIRSSCRVGVVRIADDVVSAEELRALYASCGTLVGTRLHSCILAMIEGTPAIALAYQPKAIGTYEMLGLSDLCTRVDQFDAAEIHARIERTLHEGAAARTRIESAVKRARDQVAGSYAELLT